MKAYQYTLIGLTALLIMRGVSYYALKPTPDERQITMGLNALSNMVKQDGHITYSIDFLTNNPNTKNNIVREMGSAYALAFAYHQTHSKKLKQQLITILNLTRKRCVPTLHSACFISDNPEKIKVGATALALLTELFYAQTAGDNQFADMREKWLQALLQSYRPGKGILKSPTSTETSPYFDGETWFALAVYNHFYPENKQVADTLSSLDNTLFQLYQDQYLVSFVHWGLMAAAQRFVTTHSDKFLSFMKKQFQLYTAENPTPRQGTSTCSVSEGLSDAAYFVKGYDDSFVREILNRIDINKSIIDHLQVVDIQVVGTNAEKYPHIHPDTHQYIGAFKNTPNSYKTRNDITQHCLTALFKRQRALKK